MVSLPLNHRLFYRHPLIAGALLTIALPRIVGGPDEEAFDLAELPRFLLHSLSDLVKKGKLWERVIGKYSFYALICKICCKHV